MLKERSRSAVLVCATQGDAALENLLQAVLVTTGSKGDELFPQDRHLGSFGIKIAQGARLGLIDAAGESIPQNLLNQAPLLIRVNAHHQKRVP